MDTTPPSWWGSLTEYGVLGIGVIGLSIVLYRMWGAYQDVLQLLLKEKELRLADAKQSVEDTREMGHAFQILANAIDQRGEVTGVLAKLQETQAAALMKQAEKVERLVGVLSTQADQSSSTTDRLARIEEQLRESMKRGR